MSGTAGLPWSGWSAESLPVACGGETLISKRKRKINVDRDGFKCPDFPDMTGIEEGMDVWIDRTHV
jgi:hypothetical protein